MREYHLCCIGYCIVKAGSDRAGRSHTAPRVREYLPNVVTGDDRDVRPRAPALCPACLPACLNGDTLFCAQRYTCQTPDATT